MNAEQGTPTLITVWHTPVKVKPAILANMLGLWGLLTWLAGRREPEHPVLIRLLVGGLSTLALLSADLGHALAHIVSARLARAPMDEILISEGMPRTLYRDDDVPPKAHRLRALGGPVFNGVGLLASLALRRLAPHHSAWREVLGWSSLGHGLLLAGSLAPLPIVDGGTILKWTLVEQGRTPAQADRVVRRAGLVTGAGAAAAGVALAARRRWLPALGLLAGAAVAIAAAMDKIR
jgi:hypothetical protein